MEIEINGERYVVRPHDPCVCGHEFKDHNVSCTELIAGGEPCDCPDFELDEDALELEEEIMEENAAYDRFNEERD